MCASLEFRVVRAPPAAQRCFLASTHWPRSALSGDWNPGEIPKRTSSHSSRLWVILPPSRGGGGAGGDAELTKRPKIGILVRSSFPPSPLCDGAVIPLFWPALYSTFLYSSNPLFSLFTFQVCTSFPFRVSKSLTLVFSSVSSFCMYFQYSCGLYLYFLVLIVFRVLAGFGFLGFPVLWIYRVRPYFWTLLMNLACRNALTFFTFTPWLHLDPFLIPLARTVTLSGAGHIRISDSVSSPLIVSGWRNTHLVHIFSTVFQRLRAV